MDAAPPRWAAETEVIRRLETDWNAIADSWWLRRRLEVWAAEDPRLAFEDGHRLVAAAQRRDVSSWADRDQVLAALLDRFEDDPVAQRVALQLFGLVRRRCHCIGWPSVRPELRTLAGCCRAGIGA